MKHETLNKILALGASIPLVFCLLFFGYLPLRFDAVIYTDNIIGEGMCSTYLSDSHANFAYLYEADAYFGSELKTLKLIGLRFDVSTVELHAYDVDSADIVSFDICVFGRTVSHLNKDGLSHPYTAAVNTATTTGEEALVHLEKDEDTGSMSIGFPGRSIIPISVWIIYLAIILFVSVALAAVLSFVFELAEWMALPVLNATCVIVTMLVGCFICGSLTYVDYTYFLLNWMLLFSMSLLINSLTVQCLGTALVSLFTFLWYTANYFVIQFRGKPIMPADLKALGTAKDVVGGYDLLPNWQIVAGILLVLLYLVLIGVAWKRTKPNEESSLKKYMVLRGAGVLTALVMVFAVVNNPIFSQLNTFQWDAKVLEGFHREGIVLTFVKSALSSRVKKPEGYTRERVDSYLADYSSQETTDVIQPTRIIMVMNEAFSDLRTVGLDSDIDIMPFIDSLEKNTIEGSLYVSVFGGGTCNTEFEALTGNSLAFLNAGSYPYTENVTSPLFSLASYFKSDSYATESFHSGKATSWNRDNVYQYLGFDVFHSIENYPNITDESRLHHYITDVTDYNYIEQRDVENERLPRFLFNVTIQNHSNYDHFLDVEEAKELAGHEDLNTSVRVYLSLLRISDASIEQLVEKYESSDEPTMVVFFGDHQPSLDAGAQKTVYTQVKMHLDYYKSKFFIWTNYDTDSEHNVSISANYLPWLILERGNFPLPPYVQMLKEVHEKYPVISSQGVIDAEGNVYDNVAVLLDDPLIKKYQYIQYANLFDELDDAWFEVE